MTQFHSLFLLFDLGKLALYYTSSLYQEKIRQIWLF
uniref:Uncharacterized protein n=1 Tax=Physcomitrium patens TaxID=3218 RepID=A0A2K1IVV5_PHYPA|nr:hypothetical protein PHYPA_025356 [Physcomitrium patens]